MHLYYRVHDIYFIKYVNYSHVNYFRKTLQGSEYNRVLNMPLVLEMPGFWICLWFWRCQGSENARVLNIPRFWINQGSENARILNLPRFWIYQGSEYVRVTQGSEYAWLSLAAYAWICLNMPKYAWICPNLGEWLLFYFSPL